MPDFPANIKPIRNLVIAVTAKKEIIFLMLEIVL
jgi:hypothetical protein